MIAVYVNEQGTILKRKGHNMTVQGNYTAKSGDTLSAISKQFNTTVEKLAELNGLKDTTSVLQVGQEIKFNSDDGLKVERETLTDAEVEATINTLQAMINKSKKGEYDEIVNFMQDQINNSKNDGLKVERETLTDADIEERLNSLRDELKQLIREDKQRRMNLTLDQLNQLESVDQGMLLNLIKKVQEKPNNQ